ncbi:telomerase reverse transcriptase-like isoform X2 [Branchiostoma floridae x Branchiostoma japonicum]
MAADREKQPNGSNSKAFSILQQLFPRVLSLQGYLSEQLSGRAVPVPLLQAGDSQEYTQLLQTTLVGLSAGHEPLPPRMSFEQVSNQSEVILRTIEKLCKSPRGPTKNVLTLGYRLASEKSRSFSVKAPCIEMVHPDDKIRKLDRRVWKILLSRIGDDVMTHLLGSCSLFLAAPPSCYIQITGFPLYDLHNDWHKVPVPEREIKTRTANRSLKYTSQLFKNCVIKKKVGHAKKKWRHHVKKCQRLLKTKGQQLDSSKHKQDTNLTQEKDHHALEVQQNTESGEAKVLSISSKLKRGVKRKRPEELHVVVNPRQKIGRYEDKVASQDICVSADDICVSADELAGMTVRVDPAMPSCSHQPDMGHTQTALESRHQLDTEQTCSSHEGELDDCTRQNMHITDSSSMLPDTGQTRLTGKKRKRCGKDHDRGVKRSRKDLTASKTETSKQGEQKRRRRKGFQGEADHEKNKRKSESQRKGKKELKVKLSTDAESRETLTARSTTRTETSNSIPDVPNAEQNSSYCFSTMTISKTMVLHAGQPQGESVLDDLPASNRGAQKLVEKVFLQEVEKHVHRPTNSTAAALPTSKQQQDRKCKIIRTPRRYIKAQKLFVQLLKRHEQCRYYYLVKYHCPVSLTPAVSDKDVEGSVGDKHIRDAPVLHRRPPTRTVNKETAAVNHNDIQHQAVPHSSQHILPINPSHEQHMTDDGASQVLLSQHSSIQQIYLLLRAILHKVVPADLWGSRHNRVCFLTNVLLFLRMGRYERITLHQLMTGMRLTDCDWLKLDSNTVQEFHTRSAVLGKLVWWLFNNFVITMLRSYFYITETTTQRNQVLYYRSSLWKMLKDKATEQHLSRHMLSQISQNTVKNLIRDHQCLGVANLRFVPKKTGLRPIVNMGRQEKTDMSSTGTSINYKLQNLFKVLTYEKEAAPGMLGASVFGTNDIYKRWTDFVVKRKAAGCTDPLYFVKVDIQHCFDSIPQDKLLEVMASVLSSGCDYLIRRYAKVVATRKNVQCTFEKHIAVLDDFIPCFKAFVLLQNQSGKMYDAIAVDQVIQHHASPTVMLRQLQHHVQNNVIQIGGSYYRQISGISQGSCLSTLLCSFFYADMERRHLCGMDMDGLLLRLVDDFLLVTPHLDQATAFLCTMLDGIPDYGCSVHPDKVLTNFPVQHRNAVVTCQPAVGWFPWCGMLFHTLLLGVTRDYTKYANLSIRYTLTFDLHQTPGQAMKQKLMNTVKAKCHAFFLEPKVNSAAVIQQTLYKAFLFTAHQFHNYNSCLPSRCRAQDNPAFFLRMIMDICHYPLLLVDAMVAKKVMSGQLPVSQDAVEWLCLQAFKSKLASHRSVYFSLLKPLERCIRALEKNLDCKELQQVTSQQSVAEFQSILA